MSFIIQIKKNSVWTEIVEEIIFLCTSSMSMLLNTSVCQWYCWISYLSSLAMLVVAPSSSATIVISPSCFCKDKFYFDASTYLYWLLLTPKFGRSGNVIGKEQHEVLHVYLEIHNVQELLISQKILFWDASRPGLPHVKIRKKQGKPKLV